MDTLHHQQQRIKEKNDEETKLNSCASPPSTSSSPSHEFSFTISLHSSTADKTRPPPSIEIDLSPADDIFFHGHLLPLHLLSHLPVSPRASTNSLDSFSLPIKDLLDEQKPDKSSDNCLPSNSNVDIKTSIPKHETKGRKKHKSFSLFLFGGWQKGREVGEDKEKQTKKKLGLDVIHALRRYMRTLLFFRGRGKDLHLRRPPYSFLGNSRNKHELRGRRGEHSAPASMRMSPTNSGLLFAKAPLSSTASDSSMEELQAAIQAAIAHCKKSIGVEDKLK